MMSERHSRDEFGRTWNGSRRSGREDYEHRENSRHHGRFGAHETRFQDDGRRGLYPGLVVKGEVFRIESYGGFLEFEDEDRNVNRGLVHISQLSSQRVEQVSDVLRLKDRVYAVILEIEGQHRQRRIRLSLVNVDQDSGEYKGPSIESENKYEGRGRGRPQSFQREGRARERRRIYMSFHADWKEGSQVLKNNRDAPRYLRTLWSSSPEPPQNLAVSSKKGEKSSDSNTEDSFSESSESTAYRSRRRRDGKRRRDQGNSRTDRHRRKRRRRNGRSRRRYSSSSSSSESSSSTSSSSSSDSSTSSSQSGHSTSSKREKENESRVASAEEVHNWKDSDWKNAQDLKSTVQPREADSEEEEGPMPLPQSNAAGGTASQGNATYGRALLPGEGQAIAQYVQQNLRIPRRGEIGYSGNDIDKFENSGYVMSGSRHTRMNAVRIRKENQVYSAEEQRALALITMEENQQKEAQLMEDFRVMLKDKQKSRSDAGKV